MESFRAYRVSDEGGRVQGEMTRLRLDDLDPGEVVIRTAYSSVNYKDALAATGAGKIMRRFPMVGGIDVAGEVVSSQDPRYRPGDPVLVTGYGLSEDHDGGYSELARVSADWVLPLPQGLSARDAMAIGTAGFTAALAVLRMEANGLRPDRGPVAVSGATGGVGSVATDILAAQGYEVVAISGKESKRAYLESLGASEVLSRHALEMGDRPLEKARWAGAVDPVGGAMLSWLTRTTLRHGSVASCGLAGGTELRTSVMPFILRGVNLLGVDSAYCPMDTRREVWELLAGPWRPPHLSEYTRQVGFEELPGVFGAYLDGAVSGRTVVSFDAQG
jgi:NADPH2:quinone reductase